MRCPFCRTPLLEATPECPACRLTLTRAMALLGSAPRLMPEWDDPNGRVARRSANRIRSEITRLRRRYPQIAVQITLRDFPETHPFDLHVFWLFNTAMIAGEVNKGGDNHAILLAIDPSREQAALMVGYGLEPFIGQDALDHLLDLASPMWLRRDWLEGIHIVLDGLDRLLECACVEAREAFGLPADHTLAAEAGPY